MLTVAFTDPERTVRLLTVVVAVPAHVTADVVSHAVMLACRLRGWRSAVKVSPTSLTVAPEDTEAQLQQLLK